MSYYQYMLIIKCINVFRLLQIGFACPTCISTSFWATNQIMEKCWCYCRQFEIWPVQEREEFKSNKSLMGNWHGELTETPESHPASIHPPPKKKKNRRMFQILLSLGQPPHSRVRDDFGVDELEMTLVTVGQGFRWLMMVAKQETRRGLTCPATRPQEVFRWRKQQQQTNSSII